MTEHMPIAQPLIAVRIGEITRRPHPHSTLVRVRSGAGDILSWSAECLKFCERLRA